MGYLVKSMDKDKKERTTETKGKRTEMERRQLLISEVLQELANDGINITRRTFEYYQHLGLLPKPEKQVGEKGRGVYGHYDHKVPSMAKKIIELKGQGLMLEEIAGKLKGDLVDRAEALCQHWRGDCKDFALDTHETSTKLRWWDDDDTIETHVLHELVRFTNHRIALTTCILSDINNMTTKTAETGNRVISRVTEMIRDKLDTQAIALRRYHTRLEQMRDSHDAATKKGREKGKGKAPERRRQ